MEILGTVKHTRISRLTLVRWIGDEERAVRRQALAIDCDTLEIDDDITWDGFTWTLEQIWTEVILG